MTTTVTIRFPSHFTNNQHRVIVKYLTEGRGRLSRTEWRVALSGFNQLHKAYVITQSTTLTFRQVYNLEIDQSFAQGYLAELLKLPDVSRGHSSLRTRYSRQIVRHLQDIGLQRYDSLYTNLLLAYCLYFWESFASGYAFEVEIYRDLTATGIVFDSHDILDYKGRRSFHDLKVLGLYGDIKTSLYFLHVGRSKQFPHDFYVTRFYDKKGRRRTWVVMLKPEAWNQINGDTIEMLLEDAAQAFPMPASVQLEVGKIVVADYQVWKTKVLSRQQERWHDDE